MYWMRQAGDSVHDEVCPGWRCRRYTRSCLDSLNDVALLLNAGSTYMLEIDGNGFIIVIHALNPCPSIAHEACLSTHDRDVLLWQLEAICILSASSQSPQPLRSDSLRLTVFLPRPLHCMCRRWTFSTPVKQVSAVLTCAGMSVLQRPQLWRNASAAAPSAGNSRIHPPRATLVAPAGLRSALAWLQADPTRARRANTCLGCHLLKCCADGVMRWISFCNVAQG